MNKKIYRQTDTRWSKLPYPTKAYSFGGNGCGACAVLHCIIELDKYKNWTPKNIQPYMKQFATLGNGTLWSGIKTALEHYGYIVHWNQADTISTIFKTIEKAPIKRGVILFGSTYGPDGTDWTRSGHYIAFTDYKVENGKHYFYLKDSGDRKHDKWWCYEKSMRGDVRQAFICTGIKDAPEKPEKRYPRHKGSYKGAIPYPTLKPGAKSVGSLRKFLNWYCGCKLAESGEYNKYVKKWVKVYQKAEGFPNPTGIWGEYSYKHALKYKEGRKPYPNTFPYLPTAIERQAVEYAYKYGTPLSTYRWKGGHAKKEYREDLPKLFDRKGWGTKAKYGASCDVFVSACCRKAGEAKDMPRGLKGQKSYIPKHFQRISKKEHGCIGWKSNHVLIYVGLKGKLYVANAHHNKHGGTFGIIENNRNMSKYYRPKKLTALREGDSFTPVIYLQRFLKWYGEDVKDDGFFGSKTKTAVKNFQDKTGLKVDGVCGSRTIAMMKVVRK